MIYESICFACKYTSCNTGTCKCGLNHTGPSLIKMVKEKDTEIERLKKERDALENSSQKYIDYSEKLEAIVLDQAECIVKYTAIGNFSLTAERCQDKHHDTIEQIKKERV